MSVEKHGWAIRKRPIKILHFLTSARIRKYLTQIQNCLVFLTIKHLQVESRI